MAQAGLAQWAREPPLLEPAQPRVLVVDDDKAVRSRSAVRLEFNGYACRLASDGAEALAGIGAAAPPTS